MNENQKFNANMPPNNPYPNLARWLQRVYALSPAEKPLQTSEKTVQIHKDEERDPLELPIDSDYHPNFYQQLPDFIAALLRNDSQTIVQFAPLLFHLAECRACHNAYLDLFEPIRAAFQSGEMHVVSPKMTRPLALSSRLLAQLCRLLLGQAEAVLLQARADGRNRDAYARSLLQQAIRVGSKISQRNVRVDALKDLVRVATFSTPTDESAGSQPLHIATAGTGITRHAPIARRGDLIEHEPDTIYLQSGAFEGNITQHKDMLLLHLQGLDKRFSTHHIAVSIPLGSLIDPIHWTGGNPQDIHSPTVVDEHGTLHMPLGQTSLRVTNFEDRNLLEIIFSRLEVRLKN